MEQTFQDVFRNASSVHRSIVPSRDDEANSVLDDDLSYPASRFVQDQSKVILAQETVIQKSAGDLRFTRDSTCL